MTKAQRLVAAVVIAWIVAYAMSAFVNLQTNPTEWSENSRLLFCWLGLLLSWLVGGMPYLTSKEKP